MNVVTPIEFIQAAYSDVQSLADEGEQMHRRAVCDKPLITHVHGWNSAAIRRPSVGGMVDLIGGRSVSLRVSGQFLDRGNKATFESDDEVAAFANTVSELLKTMPSPVSNNG